MLGKCLVSGANGILIILFLGFPWQALFGGVGKVTQLDLVFKVTLSLISYTAWV